MGRERINAVTTSFFGRGSIGLLPGELKKRGYRRGLIVTDRFLFEHKAADRVGEQILAAGAEYAVFYLVQPNPIGRASCRERVFGRASCRERV